MRKLGVIGFSLLCAGALLLVWMYGVDWELPIQDIQVPRFPAEAREISLPRTYFHGDLIGYSKESAALQAVRPENRIALLTLANAEAVLHRRSDISRDTPEYVEAFDRIGEDPAAPVAFRELVLRATPAGRIYGLCGLYLQRSDTFSSAQEQLTRSRSFVLYFKSYDVHVRWEVGKLAEQPEMVCPRMKGDVAPPDRTGDGS